MPDIETVQEQSTGAMDAMTSSGEARPGIGSYVGTVALVGLGVALIEEELLAGMAIGVAAMAFPGLMPKLGNPLRPLMKSAVKTGYGIAGRARETMAEMSEQFQDVVAEVRAEQEHADMAGVNGSAAPHDAGAAPEAAAGNGRPAEHEATRAKRSSKTSTNQPSERAE